MATWTREWPTEPGWYWFYGDVFAEERPRSFSTGELIARDPTLSLVEVFPASNAMVYSTRGLMFDPHCAEGWWAKADIPEPPEE